MRVNELVLRQAVLPSLAKAAIHEIEQLAEHRAGELLRHPELSSGVELDELIRERAVTLCWRAFAITPSVCGALCGVSRPGVAVPSEPMAARPWPS